MVGRLSGWPLACWLLLSACGQTPGDAVPGGSGGLRLADVLGAQSSLEFARADVVRPFRFPEDHGAHPEFRSEWWYLVSTLRSTQDEEFGVQFTLFRQAVGPYTPAQREWDLLQAYLGHVAVTDVASGMHRHAQRLSRAHPQLAAVSVDGGWRAHIEGWQLAQDGGEDSPLRLQARFGDGNSVDLTLQPECDVVLQGQQGLSHKSADSASYYYSWPRLRARGELAISGRTHVVEGLAWLDREWSTSVLAPHLSGWNWFALHLEDGRSVMVYSMTRKDGGRDPFDHGVVVTACGPDQQQRVLSSADFALRPLDWWQDDHGRRWPVRWALTLGAERFTIDALVEDQLMDTLVTYWEGIAAVTNAAGDDAGRAYMELTGY